MNEWASKFLSPLSGMTDRNKADFDQFMAEVNNDQMEHMYYSKELDADLECRPTFDQLSMDRIFDETQRNILTMKSLETILYERHNGYSALNSSLLKARAAFEGFETTEGTLKLAADAFYIFSEQEAAQSKQQIFLSDLKTSLNQIRHDAQRKLSDYQREISAVEKEVSTAEKRVSRSKEAQEKGLDYRSKLEAFELDGLLNNVRGKTKDRSDGRQSAEDLTARLEKEMKEDIQNLLGAISKRDQVLSASRRAFQKLDRDCKRAIYYTLRKIVDKEKDSLETRRIVLEKFEQNVLAVDVESDVNDFIENFRMEEGSLTLNARALSLLDDLSSTGLSAHSGSGSNHGSNSVSPASGSSAKTRSHSFKDHLSSSASTGGFSNSSSSNATSPADNHGGNESRKGSLIGGAISAAMSAMKSSSSLHNTSSAPASAVPGIQGSTHTHPSAGSTISTAGTASLSWEFSAYLSQIFYETLDSIATAPSTLGGSTADYEDLSESLSAPATATATSAAGVAAVDISGGSGGGGGGSASQSHSSLTTKAMHRKTRVLNNMKVQYHDVKTLDDREFLKIEANRALADAVDWLCTAVQTKRGRDTFIAELNQFRSRKVELAGGFDALGVVLWKTLTCCQEQNDVHNAKIIMMLSQTFYRIRPTNDTGTDSSDSVADSRENRQDSYDDDAPKRGVEFREYIKEKLMGHALWEDGNFWEQALWQCAIEQLQTIPYERPWYEMEKEMRNEAVRRVHDVLFSQVMAIIHSMMELGCQQRQTREFLYRMSAVHQLSEGQRQQLLAMVLKR